jgi:hypothetical protein
MVLNKKQIESYEQKKTEMMSKVKGWLKEFDSKKS